MDDNLLSHLVLDILQNLLAHVVEQLPKWGLLNLLIRYKNDLPFHVCDSLLRDRLSFPQK
jgi:hypothetical protein